MVRVLQLALLSVLFILPYPSSKATEGWKPANTHAVIIGVTRWQADLTRYSRRHRKDRELRDLLVQRGVPVENISMLLDSQATLANIRQAINSHLLKTTSESTLLIYYAGHGWKMGDDFCFANYDVRLGRDSQNTAWTISELANRVDQSFHGRQAIFLGDCCHSGGMRLIVEKLQARNVPSFSLTSATTANTSTGNWTFTQCIIDALTELPLMDRDRDGMITLGELRTEVAEAMLHLEGQSSGFLSGGIDDGFVIGETNGAVIDVPNLRFPLGSYVRVRGRYGRVVGIKGDSTEPYVVEFYNYTEKQVKKYSEADLRASLRSTNRRTSAMEPDCEVEWRGRWYPAKVLREANGQWYIHYIDDDDSWDEWVGRERIRFGNDK